MLKVGLGICNKERKLRHFITSNLKSIKTGRDVGAFLSFFSSKDITINVIFILHRWYINANENKPNEAVPQFCKVMGIIIEIFPEY